MAARGRATWSFSLHARWSALLSTSQTVKPDERKPRIGDTTPGFVSSARPLRFRTEFVANAYLCATRCAMPRTGLRSSPALAADKARGAHLGQRSAIGPLKTRGWIWWKQMSLSSDKTTKMEPYLWSGLAVKVWSR